MIALLQRVKEAHVDVHADGHDERVAAIGPGLLAFIGVERGDGAREAERLVERVLSHRLFSDGEGRMNLDLRQAGGELLMVSQFTLAGDTRRGNRPGFQTAAPPDEGRRWFDHAVEAARREFGKVQTGRFGAMMAVGLVNDGPVTIHLRVPPVADG